MSHRFVINDPADRNFREHFLSIQGTLTPRFGSMLSDFLPPLPGTDTVRRMITIESTEKEIRVSIPRDEVDPVRLERLLRPFRLDAAVSGGGMTADEADRMAEEMKAIWWEENRHRFLPDEPT